MLSTNITDDCIEWDRARSPKDYGVVWVPKLRLMRLVHRLAWEEENGPVPDGLCVCHICDNPPCFNVDHLFLGTRAENNADMWSKGRGRVPMGEAHRSIKLTVDQVAEIRASLARGEGVRSVARRFSIAHTSILRLRPWR